MGILHKFYSIMVFFTKQLIPTSFAQLFKKKKNLFIEVGEDLQKMSVMVKKKRKIKDV